MAFTVTFYARNPDGESQLQGVCNYDCFDGLDVQAVLKDLGDEISEKNTEEGFPATYALTGGLLTVTYPWELDKDLNRVINWVMRICHWRLFRHHHAKHPYEPEE